MKTVIVAALLLVSSIAHAGIISRTAGAAVVGGVAGAAVGSMVSRPAPASTQPVHPTIVPLGRTIVTCRLSYNGTCNISGLSPLEFAGYNGYKLVYSQRLIRCDSSSSNCIMMEVSK